jgi:hypothetical protein
MKNLFLFILLFTVSLIAAQADSSKIMSESEKDCVRKTFFSSGIIGCPDILSVNYGYQITENFSVSLKSSLFAIAGSQWGGVFFGLRLGYHTSTKKLYVFNAFGFEINHTAHAFELTAGYENISCKFFSFYWAVGLSGSISKFENGEPVKYLPVIKWGVNLNF